MGRLRGRCARYAALLACALGWLVATEGAASAQDAAPAARATLLIKVLSMDRALRVPSRRVVVGVMYRAGSPDSERDRDQMVRAMQQVAARATLRGVHPQVVAIAYDRAAAAERMRAAGISAIYLTRGLDDAVTTVAAAARGLRIRTLCGSLAYVRAGMAVGVATRSNAPSIIVNLRVARQIGMDLDSRVLSIAVVVR